MRLHHLLILAGLVPPLAASASAQQPIATEPVASGLNAPLYVTHAPGDDASRIFIVTQFGKIRIVKDGTLLTAPFLDINSKITFSGEQGLLGMAFHPDYEQNGFFYVNYSDDTGGDTVIERYQVDPTDPDSALPASAFELLGIDQPFSNHNGGWIDFGPDGYLYIGMGDGGSGGDPGNRAQNGQELLGKILRIDVDNPSGGLNYGIPPSNPFVNDPLVLDEIWAIGMRNPWRCEFDNETGDLWIADVGQDKWEEIDFEPAGSGGQNYGWRIMEGNHCFNPATNCNQTGLILPVYEYSHGGAPFRCSVSGGVVYRGRAMADMHARYFFSDYCSGQTWSFRLSGGTTVVDFVEHTTELDPPGSPTLGSIVSFGEDADGEMYVVDQAGGDVYRIVPAGLRLNLPELVAGSATSATVSGGAPTGLTGLFYSFTGLGSTPLPPANVTLGIASGTLIATVLADGAGTATFAGSVPAGLQGATLWMQAAQMNVKSNIVLEVVE